MMWRIFTAIIAFTAVSLNLVTIYLFAIASDSNVFHNGEFVIKRTRNLFTNGSIHLFDDAVAALSGSVGPIGSSWLHQAGDIMVPAFTEESKRFLKSLLTKEIGDDVVWILSYLLVLLVGLWKLYAIYKNRTEFTQDKVNELKEQLQEQEDRKKALLTRYRMAKLAAKRYCSTRGCRRYNHNVDSKRNKNARKSRKRGRAKNIAQESRKLVPSIGNRLEICDVSSSCDSFNADDQNSLVLCEDTRHNSFTALKLDSDVAAKLGDSWPSTVVSGSSNAQTCNCSNNGASSGNHSAGSGVATFKPSSKTKPTFGVKLQTVSHLFLDSSAAGLMVKTPVIPTDVQPLCKVELEHGRSLRVYPQIDDAVTSISDTFTTNGSTTICAKTSISGCNNALRPMARKNDSLGMLSSFIDNQTATVSSLTRTSVTINRCCSMPLLVEADFAATIQTPRCSQSWTNELTALRSPRITNTFPKEISVRLSYRQVCFSMEDLRSRCHKYAHIDRVYSNSWSPGDTIVIQHYKSCDGQLSDRNVRQLGSRPRIHQSENDIFDIDIFGSSSCSSLTSSESMPQNSPALHRDLVRAGPEVMEYYQSNFAVEIPGADFDQYSPIGSLGALSFGNNSSLSSGFQSETSSIDSDLERELFGDPFDVDPVRSPPSTSALDLVEVTGLTSNQPQLPQASTPLVCTDYYFATTGDESSFWFEDSPSSSLDSDLKKALLEDPETMMSRRLLKRCDSDKSPESCNLDTTLKSSYSDSNLESSGTDTNLESSDSESCNFDTNSKSSDPDSNSESFDTDSNSESSELDRSNLQHKIFEDQESMISRQKVWSARSLPMDKSGFEDSSRRFVQKRNIGRPGQGVPRQQNLVVSHCVPMLSAGPMSDCSFTSHSPASFQMPSCPGQLRVSGASQIWPEIRAEEDAVFDSSTESELSEEPQTRILMKQHNEDRLPQDEWQGHLTSEEKSNEEEEVSRSLDDPRKLSSARHQVLDALIHRRHSGEAEAFLSLQSLNLPAFTRLPRYLHSIRDLLRIDLSTVVTERNVLKSGQSSDSSGYFCTYATTPSETSVRIVSWRFWKGAEKSKTLRRILASVYGPPPPGVSDDAFLKGLKKPVRNDGLASTISAKAPASARQALLQSLETRDDLRYSTYQLELFSQIAALNECERVRFCSETQRKNKLALSVLERKKDGLKAALSSSDERPKKAFTRFLKALKRIGKSEQPGEQLVKVCREISALRKKIVECAEVWEEVQEQRRRSHQRRQLQERIFACEKALVDCVRRGFTLRSNMKRHNTSVRCYDCDVGRHEVPMIAPIFSSPPLLGENNGFSCDCPLIQNINASYDALDLESRGISNATKLDRIHGFLKKVQTAVFRKSFLLNGQIAL